MNINGQCKSCDDSEKRINNIARDECNRCPNRMWSSYNGGRCITRMKKDGDYWGSLSKEECEKFPKQYSIQNNTCFYCEGTFDRVTGVCSTMSCQGKSGNHVYGLTRSNCTECNGRYNTYSVEGGIVSVCWID